MKIYQTNAGLGYNQFAFLIRLDKSQNGFNYLCISTINVNSDTYKIGKVVKDLEDFYVVETDFDYKNSPLYNEHFYNFLLTNKN